MKCASLIVSPYGPLQMLVKAFSFFNESILICMLLLSMKFANSRFLFPTSHFSTNNFFYFISSTATLTSKSACAKFLYFFSINCVAIRKCLNFLTWALRRYFNVWIILNVSFLKQCKEFHPRTTEYYNITYTFSSSQILWSYGRIFFASVVVWIITILKLGGFLFSYSRYWVQYYPVRLSCSVNKFSCYLSSAELVTLYWLPSWKEFILCRRLSSADNAQWHTDRTHRRQCSCIVLWWQGCNMNVSLVIVCVHHGYTEYKGRTDSNSPAVPNESVIVAILYYYNSLYL